MIYKGFVIQVGLKLKYVEIQNSQNYRNCIKQ